jgi:hypothetical protein
LGNLAKNNYNLKKYLNQEQRKIPELSSTVGLHIISQMLILQTAVLYLALNTQDWAKIEQHGESVFTAVTARGRQKLLSGSKASGYWLSPLSPPSPQNFPFYRHNNAGDNTAAAEPGGGGVRILMQ